MDENNEVRHHDRQVVADLCRKHYKRLAGYFRRKGCSHDIASDLAQNVFLKLLSSSVSISELDNTEGYMWRVAFNVFLDFVGSKSARNDMVTTSVNLPSSDDSEEVNEIPISVPDDAVEYVAALEGLRGCIANCFNEMAQQDAWRAEALRLSAIEGWDVEQIRQFLDKPTRASVSTYLNQTRTKLKPCVEKCNDYVEVMDEHR